ncbi:hypothetical protein DPX16_23891 [Anabarilius grahami]|uniref:Uncharacterized protein n=1 Tax=Anabarilius grahami TaxID=495550 RepID=A0A3N0YUL5_ANAGA|nr:hypothetical protein DPX16_23891 [Anabarilius grahami]
MADRKDWLGVVRNTLLTRAADHLQHQSQKQLDKDGREVKADDSNQRYDHDDLTEVNFFLAHNLTGLKQEVNTLQLQITETHKELMHAKSHIDQLEMEAQDRHKDPDRIEAQKKIHKTSKVLTTAQQREQLEKAAREDLMLSLTAQMADRKDWLGVVRNTLLTTYNTYNTRAKSNWTKMEEK